MIRGFFVLALPTNENKNRILVSDDLGFSVFGHGLISVGNTRCHAKPAIRLPYAICSCFGNLGRIQRGKCLVYLEKKSEKA